MFNRIVTTEVGGRVHWMVTDLSVSVTASTSVGLDGKMSAKNRGQLRLSKGVNSW
jgi:hypothetical protein